MITNNMTYNTTREAAIKNRHHSCKTVLCIDTNETFNSAKEAAEHFGTTIQTISDVCNGRVKSYKGMQFCYLDENNNPIPKKEPRKVTIQKQATLEVEGTHDNGNCKEVLCITDGRRFASCTDAAEFYGTTTASMSNVCRGINQYTKGRRFCYVKDIYLHLNEIAEHINKSNAYDSMLVEEQQRNAALAEREAERQRLIAEVEKWESECARIDAEIIRLGEQQSVAYSELAKAKDNLMYFNI